MFRHKLPLLFSIWIIVIGVTFLTLANNAWAAAGDVNHDEKIDLTDIVLVLTNWLSPTLGCLTNQSYICDQNDDGKTNVFDLVTVINNLTAASTATFPFGPFHYFETQSGPTAYTGGMIDVNAGNALTALNNARTNKARVLIHMTGGRSNFQNADQSFSLSLWEQTLDTFLTNLGGGNISQGKTIIQGYVDDGTIAGHLMMDEPQDTVGNWGGHPVSTADLEAAASYSKQKWPGLAAGIGSNPGWLQTNICSGCYQYLDFTSTPFASFRLSPNCQENSDPYGTDTNDCYKDTAEFIAIQTGRSQSLGLRIALSINVLDGGFPRGSDLPATDLETIGVTFVNDPYNSMLTFWTWDATYFSQSAVNDSAIPAISAAASARVTYHSLLAR